MVLSGLPSRCQVPLTIATSKGLPPKMRSVASVIKNWCYTTTSIIAQGNAFSASGIRSVANFRLQSPTNCFSHVPLDTCEGLWKKQKTLPSQRIGVLTQELLPRGPERLGEPMSPSRWSSDFSGGWVRLLHIKSASSSQKFPLSLLP